MNLTVIEFVSLFFYLLIDSIELELADHDDGVGVFKFLEDGSILFDDGDEVIFGIWRDHEKNYKGKIKN